MDEIERTTRISRGGSDIGDWRARKVLPELIADALDEYLYKQIEFQSSQQSSDSTYTDNLTFWDKTLSNYHFQGMRVRLQGFHLTEWLPSSPGRYYTPEAQPSRHQARKYLNYEIGEYNPDGKEFMIFGGVGSVRLAANLSNNTYFLGATSTGITYQGIPVVLHEEQYYQVIRIIKNHGGCLTNLVGTLHIFPPHKRLIEYPQKIEKYYLAVDSVEVIRPSGNGELLAAVAIAFQMDDRYNKAWSYCSFNPNPNIKDKSLDKAVDWLIGYTKRYSDVKQIKILSDFDELSQHFNFPVELPLFQRPSSEKIQAVIESYAPILNIAESSAVIIANNYGSGSQSIISKIVGSVDVSTSTNTSNKPSNPWISGSYYLVVFLTVIGALCVVGKVLSIWALPIVVIGGILALSVIGAFQLRQDDKLSQENFVKLMVLSLRSLSFIKPPSQKTDKSNVSTLTPAKPNSTPD